MTCITRVLIIGIAVLFAPVAEREAAAASCDAQYVKVEDKTITVLPTLGDDTANLQCAFDLGATLGPGVSIRLAAGTFTTAQLVVNGLRGEIRGAGVDSSGDWRTKVHNPFDTVMPIDWPGCAALQAPCFTDAPPSADNRYPALLSIIGTDVRLSDIEFDVVGTHLVTPWWAFGFPVDGLSEVIQFVGSKASLDVRRIKTTGTPIAPDENFVFGGVAADLNFWDWWVRLVTDSTLVIRDSTFTNGMVIYDLNRSRVTIADSAFVLPPATDFANAAAVYLSDMRDSQVMFSRNQVTASSGVFAWPGLANTGIGGTQLLFDNNAFAGGSAIGVINDSFADVSCLAVNNDVSGVAPPAYQFGNNVCKVVGRR